MRVALRAYCTFLLATAASCGGAATAPRPKAATATTATTATTASAAADGWAKPPDDGWASASWEDRHDTMEFVVHPSMARLFQAHDRKPAPDMTCRTCHGADAEAVQYKMPRGLPALDPAHLPDPSGSDARAKIAKFMIEEVTPKMIELLDVAPYDTKTKRGFGCFNCHPSSAKP